MTKIITKTDVLCRADDPGRWRHLERDTEGGYDKGGRGMSDQITVERVLEVLELVVAREGEDTKRECKYVVHGQAHCIGGTVLFELGVPLSHLVKLEGTSVSSFTSVGGVSLSDGAGRVLRTAQVAQDAGCVWGEALEMAKAKAMGEIE